MNRKIATALNTVILVILGWCGLSTPAFCQETNIDEHHNHEMGELELGLSVGYAYLKEEKEEGVNLHLHLMKRLSGEGIKKYLSVGFGAETIFTDERHYGLMISLVAHPWRSLAVSVSPGVEWAKHDGEWESEYATHLEAAYVFEGSGFHFGPVIGYSKTQDDEHYTAGVHFAWPL